MINWRKHFILAGLHLTGSATVKYLNELEESQYWESSRLKKLQEQRLHKLLLHAFTHVPYYRKVLTESGVIKNNTVYLNRFSRIPILTKEIIRKQGQQLHSDDSHSRGTFANTSGGSTGIPVPFIQDKQYMDSNNAAKFYFFKMLGADIGEPTIKLWGSERDLFSGSIGAKAKLENFLLNRYFMNSFRMKPNDMHLFCRQWNDIKPVAVWSYVESIAQLAKFSEEQHITLSPPRAVITTAGTLSDQVREHVQRVLKTPVYNFYGSREVGPIACEGPDQSGLLIFETMQYVEVLDEQLKPCPPGKPGQVYITLLTNYSMPFIRYQIGDIATWYSGKSKDRRNFKRLASVEGRVTSHFKLQDGTIVHGEYFTHLFYFRPWVQQFQVHQTSYKRVVCNIVKTSKPPQSDIKEIQQKIKLVMGRQCQVIIKYVKEIQPSSSGKFMFTVSDL